MNYFNMQLKVNDIITKGDEKWKPIVNYEGLYEISSFGRVKSIKRNGTLGGIIKPQKTKHGYYAIYLSKNNIVGRYTAHRLTAQAFIQNKENKPYINHIDSNKLNNNVSNLEWCTAKENIQHASSKGRLGKNCGENQGNVKLTENDVLNIRNSTLKNSELSIIYKVNRSAISKIINRTTWKHI